MIDELRAMTVFAKTVETGSFRAASRELGLSPSVVSHHVSQLENKLGVALLYRSTRRLSLTSDGEKLFGFAKQMLALAENGFDAIATKATVPSGKLTITLPAGFIQGPMVDDLAKFAQDHPNVKLSVNFSDHQQDIIRDGIDVAIRVGTVQDSTLKSKKLADLERKLVVSPIYMESRPKPLKIQDLSSWDFIGLKMRPNDKRLTNKSGESICLAYEPQIVLDNIHAVVQMARAGLGVITPPDFLVAEDIKQGKMIELFPKWKVESLPVYAIWPPNAPREGLTHRFIHYLELSGKKRQSVSSP
ncbi:transcriptional regulator [Kiloniella litopenaei]|uniref:Transcriptional regulator n=1 Tax=Kiloniella litopenaei TaxID=1549748 RepID=A0A0M2R8Z2_9PROT|nr:LysR family transcriptional regulator [Kiloniella litopenaei]KKJ78302.1 transcriptional regulator [Kiloniella litopenaei]